MSEPAPRLTAVTLGVKDLRVSTAFYEALGFVRKFRATGDEITFLDGGGIVIALWSWSKLADDACLSGGPPQGAFRGTTLARNCATPAEVDAAFAKAVAARAKPSGIPKAPITAAIADIFPIPMAMSGKSCKRRDYLSQPMAE